MKILSSVAFAFTFAMAFSHPGIAASLKQAVAAPTKASTTKPVPSAVDKKTASPLKTETTMDMAGLRVLSIESKSILDQLGIQKNDVLTSINGKPIEKIEDIEIFFQERKSKQVSLELIRNGRPEIFTYDLK